MKNLTAIADLTEDSMKELIQKGQNIFTLKRTLISLYRLRKGWERFFDDFYRYLNKITKNGKNIEFYSNFKFFLEKHYCSPPFQYIQKYLIQNGFTLKKIETLELERHETALIEKIPNKKIFLLVLIYYLYNPMLSQKFFIDNFSFPLSNDDQEFLADYHKLPDDLQKRARRYLKKLLEESENSY